MPRFVILVHDHPFLHWDLLLQNGENCRAWRLLRAPDAAETPIPAEILPDHRLMYLDYEGPVRGNRGSVKRWDAGELEWQINDPERVEVALQGLLWKGHVRLAQAQD